MSTASILLGYPEGMGMMTIKTVTVSDKTGDILNYE